MKMYFEYKNPNCPLLNRNAIEIIDELLTINDNVLELGAGRSTIFFANRCNHIISFESDEFWFEKLVSKINNERLKNVQLLLVKSLSDYTLEINKIKNHSINFCLIDSYNYRFELMHLVIDKIKPGGFLLIDDANRYFVNSSNSPDSLKDEKFMSPIVQSFIRKVDGKRKFWTSDGVHDCLFILF